MRISRCADIPILRWDPLIRYRPLDRILFTTKRSKIQRILRSKSAKSSQFFFFRNLSLYIPSQNKTFHSMLRRSERKSLVFTDKNVRKYNFPAPTRKRSPFFESYPITMLKNGIFHWTRVKTGLLASLFVQTFGNSILKFEWSCFFWFFFSFWFLLPYQKLPKASRPIKLLHIYWGENLMLDDSQNLLKPRPKLARPRSEQYRHLRREVRREVPWIEL